MKNISEDIKNSIINTLNVNLNYKPGETVAIILQLWDPKFDPSFKVLFDKSQELCEVMYQVFKENNIDVKLLCYKPEIARNGVDTSQQVYDNIGNTDIIFMPTAFSLSHTDFRKQQTEKGSRIASIPTFTLEMFEKEGPMNIDYTEMEQRTNEIAEKMKNCKFIRVTGDETDIIIEIDNTTTHSATGLLKEKSQWGNLPGAEAYAVPTHLGNSHGYFTVPINWGGQKPLKHKAKFLIKQGRFTDIVGENIEAQEYIDKEIKPLFTQENHDILAEIGIGTNKNIDEDFLKKFSWSILTAEKIHGSAHFANGNSSSMGGKNNVPVHIDWVVPNVEIEYLNS